MSHKKSFMAILTIWNHSQPHSYCCHLKKKGKGIIKIIQNRTPSVMALPIEKTTAMADTAAMKSVLL